MPPLVPVRYLTADAPSANGPGPYQFQRLLQPFAAVDRLVRRRRAVVRRPAAQDVAYVYLLTLQPHRRDDARKQLTCGTYERLADGVLVAARRLADKTDLGIDAADAEHRLRPRGGQLLAARAAGDLFRQQLQVQPPLIDRQNRGGGDDFCLEKALRRDRRRLRGPLRQRRRRRQPVHAGRPQALQVSPHLGRQVRRPFFLLLRHHAILRRLSCLNARPPLQCHRGTVRPTDGPINI